MTMNLELKNTEHLLDEADALIQQINADVLKDMKEAHRMQFEKYTQQLEQIKSEFEKKVLKKEASDIKSGADGMHEAIMDIVKAMHNFKAKLF